MVIGLRESAIYHHKFATCLDGILATAGMYGHVTIDDVASLTLNTECIEYTIANLLVVAQLEVVTLLLAVGFLVLKEITLKGGHL